jgi:serine/threonine protein phosphatase 1
MSKKTLVIGDIHGALKALKQTMQRASVSKNDRLIFLGDYVDGWGESAEVIEYLIQVSKQQDCIFIKGNHDVWCEEWLKTNVANKTWLLHGGVSTVESYKHLSNDKKLEHLHFFEQMKFYETDSKNRLFIHAGFTSMHGPQQEFHASNYNWDRTLWEMALIMDKPKFCNRLIQ